MTHALLPKVRDDLAVLSEKDQACPSLKCDWCTSGFDELKPPTFTELYSRTFGFHEEIQRLQGVYEEMLNRNLESAQRTMMQRAAFGDSERLW